MPEPNSDPVEDPKDPKPEEEPSGGDDPKDEPEGNDPEPSKEPAKEPTEDPKEHNRKGYEQRKQAETKDGVSREEFEKLNETVSNMAGENEQLKFQKANPWCTDELYKSLDAQSKGSGVAKDEIIKNDPIWKNYIDSSEAKSRVDGATASPSTKTSPGNKFPDYTNMSSEDFLKQKESVLQRRGD